MTKKYVLEEGQIFAIPLSDGSFTVGQLVNHHPLKKGLSVDTYAFFSHKFSDEKEMLANIENIDLGKPYSIITSSGAPWQYDWKWIKNEEVDFDKNRLCSTLDDGGYIDGTSTNPAVLLKAYFALFPWDGYFKDDYLEEFLLPNEKIPDNVKYLKDFTTEELKELLPPNSPKLMQRLKED